MAAGSRWIRRGPCKARFAITPQWRLAHVLPRIASGYIDLPVVGLTGLSGSYDFQFEWVVKEKQTDAPGPTVFVAVEGLGLKLEQRKHPAPIVVIERVDRTPAIN